MPFPPRLLGRSLINTPAGTIDYLMREIVIALLRDESGNELVEYAIVLSVFALASILTVQIMGSTANSKVEIDETNYTNAFVNGY